MGRGGGQELIKRIDKKADGIKRAKKKEKKSEQLGAIRGKKNFPLSLSLSLSLSLEKKNSRARARKLHSESYERK
jgi:hypothetical protein